MQIFFNSSEMTINLSLLFLASYIEIMPFAKSMFSTFKFNASEILKPQQYKNLNNKYPMKMKGDFRELIEKNKDLLKHINPRIQITNATCELEQFSEEGQKNKRPRAHGARP